MIRSKADFFTYCNGLKVCLTCTTEVIVPWCWLSHCQVPFHKSHPCTLCFIFLSPLCDNMSEGTSNFKRGGWTRVQKSGYPVTADITYLLPIRVTPNTSKKRKINMSKMYLHTRKPHQPSFKSSRLRDNILHFSRDGSSSTDEQKHTTEYPLA